MAWKSFLTAIVLSMGIAVSISIPTTALAQPQCDVRENVLDVLATKYEEHPVSMGVTSNGGLLEVLASDGGATWSILVTTPQGMSCLVAAGEGWRGQLPAVADDPGA